MAPRASAAGRASVRGGFEAQSTSVRVPKTANVTAVQHRGGARSSSWLRLLMGSLPRPAVPLRALLLLAAAGAVTASDGWSTGRATWYGVNDGMNIDWGSCMFGPLPNGMVSTGTNIAALSDKFDGFAGSCGRCYEVQCNPSTFSDGYGQSLDRNGACKDGSSVIVTITDACPCDYPANAYSNRRWCCGDMQHMDLSSSAFSQLADMGLGVIGIKYRPVECPGGFKASPRSNTWDFMQGTTG